MFHFLKSVLRGKPKKSVAVITPIYRLPLTAEEEISLQHLHHFLGNADKFIIAPESLELSFPEFQIQRFADSYFSGIPGYNELMLAPEFYQSFADYQHILIYQLDCLVFSGDLESWCEKNWDYVGAPWFQGYENESSGELWAVGNGGLSLRNVRRCLKVLGNKARVDLLVRENIDREVLEKNDAQARLSVKKLLRKHGYGNDPKWFLDQSIVNEDKFWAFEARHLLPGFRIPSPEQALAFSFEYDPRICFEKNGSRLPFGCHAWAKYDADFWKRHLLENVTQP